MAVSQHFLTKLDELMAFSDEPCLCDGIVMCRRCVAEMCLDDIRSKIEDSVERIQSINQSIS